MGAASCKTNGKCDGAGACQQYSNTTQCVAATCVGSTTTPARLCDGAGTCLAVAPGQCDPFLCDTNGMCKNTCTPATSSTDCVSTATCTGTTCGKKPNGFTCMSMTECNSNNCVDGYCCDKPCAGNCQACNITGSQGTCTLVPVGSDPRNVCTDNGAAGCGTNGACDGNGGCQLYANGTQCVASTCNSGNTLTQARTCNGTGTCQAATTTTCQGGFNCDTTAKMCKTTCTIATSTTDCAAPNFCTGTICGTLELQYKCNQTASMNNSPTPWFQIINKGTAAVNLSDLTIRYWYTADGAATQTGVIYDARNSANAAIGTDTTATFTAATPTRMNADTYFQIGFTTAAGTVNANGGTATVQSAFHSTAPDYGVNYNQANDYSFDATKTAFTDWTHVTLYLKGTLVWGIEPM
jgi:hypothetical protein